MNVQIYRTAEGAIGIATETVPPPPGAKIIFSPETEEERSLAHDFAIRVLQAPKPESVNHNPNHPLPRTPVEHLMEDAFTR
jgi:hypothetical protein